jgi:hypothetical protein
LNLLNYLVAVATFYNYVSSFGNNLVTNISTREKQ